jgi:hypothetical protein
MSYYSDQVRKLLLVIRRGKFRALGRELAHRIFSNSESYLLRRDLSVPFEAPPPKQPIEIRPISDRDIPEILKARPGRLLILRANIPTCYLAVTASGEICYMQWLIGAGAQERFGPFFKGELKPLREDEVLLEFAYTFEQFRGQKIMGAAMAAIAEQGLLSGARWAVTYVLTDNVPALKGCSQAGFSPYLIREERWRFFAFRQSFRSLPARAQFSIEPARAQVMDKTGKCLQAERTASP